MNYNQQYSPKKILVVLAAAIAVLLLLFGYLSCVGGEDDEQDDTTPPVAENSEQNDGPATVRVTFAEGLNIMQYAARLEENGVCTADEFYTAMNTVDFSSEYSFLPPFEELSGRIYYLEGYLFPDTYDFYVGESAESVIRRFLNRFGQLVTDEMMAQVASVSEAYGEEFTFDDIVIMASIVEREISIPEEMDGVAAVFYNRIKHPGGTVNGSATGGCFQSDATKFYPYIFGTAHEGFVSEYNTFNVKGLPKGPICCPSIDAIKASLAPDLEEDAFFFYTDINKKVYYAVTYDEHLKNYRYCIENDLDP